MLYFFKCNNHLQFDTLHYLKQISRNTWNFTCSLYFQVQLFVGWARDVKNQVKHIINWSTWNKAKAQNVEFINFKIANGYQITIYLGGLPRSLLLPSIWICTFMRSVGLAQNWAMAPEVTPPIADFLQYKN